MNEILPKAEPGPRSGTKQPEGQGVIAALLDPEIEDQLVVDILGAPISASR